MRVLRAIFCSVSVALTVTLAIAGLGRDATAATAPQDAAPQEAPQSETPPPASRAPGLELAAVSAEEAEALNRLGNARTWPQRALAVMRLERFDCEASAGRLLAMAGDASWRVRAYAFACLARRGILVDEARLAQETDPRVLRTILRARYELPLTTIDARIRRCEESQNLFEATVALECLAAIDESRLAPVDRKPVRERMDELLSRIVLRMDRAQGGTLSPRLAAITSGDDSGRNYRWREWYRKHKSRPGYAAAALVPASPAGTRLVERNQVADLDGERFAAFEKYLASVADRPMDLAIMIDCTASMSKELADAQGGIDDLVDFLGSVTKGVRIGIVGYRDKSDDWETKGWDFTASLDEARSRLWSLSADGGGDAPESVHAAMKLALTKFSWLADATGSAPQPIRACVIVGDAPPHAGEGGLCIDLAKRAFARGVRFYGIVARDSEANLKAEDADDAPPRPTRGPADDAGGDGDDAAPSKRPRDRQPGQVEPPKPPPPTMKKKTSYTWFPEIAEAGGGRAEILKDKDSLIAEIAELTVADKYREEFADFFTAFRLLCR